MEVDFYFERSVENGLDPAHNEFVHPTQGSPGMLQDFRKKPLDVSDIPWGSQFHVSFFEQERDETVMKGLRSDNTNVVAGSCHYGPNTLVTWIKFTETNSLHQYFFEAPIDDGHTRIFFINLRNCMLEPDLDETVDKINLQVAGEDIGILTQLNPIRTPETNIKEILMPSDQAVVRYREYLKGWEANGWRIDLETLEAKKGDVAFAIPCPERRTTGNWVLDPIPLTAPAQEKKAAAE